MTAKRQGGRAWGGVILAGAVSIMAGAGAAYMLLGGSPADPPLVAGTAPAAPSRPVSAAPAPPSTAPDAEAAATARRAQIAEEEARLAALRSTRARLEQEVAALGQEAESRRRELAARRTTNDLAAGPAAQAPGAGGGGPALSAPAPAAAALPPPPPPAPAVPATSSAPVAAEAPGRGLRVFVHHRANSASGAAAAEEVAQNLRGAGVEVSGVRPAPFVPSAPVVRYFHEQDQAAAARLAGRLGRGWAIQDFRAFLPQPPPQTLEVWLPAN